MTRQITNIAFFVILLCLVANAQNISSVNISCDKLPNNTSISLIAKYYENKIFKANFVDSIKTRISTFLQDEGFYNFYCKETQILFSSDSSKVDIHFSVECNKQARIKNIYFTSSQNSDSAYYAIFKTLENSYFQKDLIFQKINQILHGFDQNKFPFASVQIKGLEFLDSTNFSEVNLLIELLSNEKAKIDKLLIVGNEYTKKFVIERSIRVFEGDFYNEKKIKEIPEILHRLNYFSSIKPPAYFLNNNFGVLKIELVEKSTNAFNGVLGYIPPANKNTGYFTGDINFSLRNLFGTGRDAQLKWAALNKDSQEFELGYLEPWLFGYPLNLNANFKQLNQDSLFTKFAISASLEFLISQNFSAAILIESSSVFSDSNLQRNNRFNSSFFSTGINFKYDSRDNLTFPTSGFLINNSYSLIKKNFSSFEKIEIPESVQLQKIKLGIESYLSFFNRCALYTSGNYYNIIGDKLELADMFQIGGNKTVRGYSEKQFYGNNIIWLNTEMRYQLDLSSYVFLFYDLGYCKQNKNEFAGLPEAINTIYGFGGGLSFETNFGIFSISYAVSKDGGLADGKIHFGFKNDF